jgi:RNA polymerase sigma-70 factor (ECF subfamily)
MLMGGSEGAARFVIGSVEPRQQRKVRDVVVDVCDEDLESKNAPHGSPTTMLMGTKTSRSTAPDDEFVGLLQTGSNSAFERLHCLYSRRLFQQIIAVTRNVEDAEDGLQETFFQAFRAVRSFEGRSHIATWLTRIAINAALMKVRKRRSRSEVSFEWPSESEEDSWTFDLRDPSPNPEQIQEERQLRDLLAHAIERLDPTLRSTVALWVSRGGSMPEIASVMGVSLCTVKTRMYRARNKLRRSRLQKP